jgi:hypothetical protein
MKSDAGEFAFGPIIPKLDRFRSAFVVQVETAKISKFFLGIAYVF